MTKIVIVGPDEKEWDNENQYKGAIKTIRKLLLKKDNYTQNIKDEIILVTGSCPYGGIDKLAEYEARKLKMKEPELHPPEVNKWNDSGRKGTSSYKKGYRTRNMDMAYSGDIGFCIVPYKFSKRCKHHNCYGHPSNGGCFTIKEMEKLKKETHLIIIW